MIKSITVTNHLGESIKLELGFPEKSGFLIQEITGLGPCLATINSTELATSDGATFNSARVGTRNIVLSLKFLFKPTVEHVRQLSYKYFPIKKRVRLLIETDNRLAETYGYVESNEPSIFSDSSGTQISIICHDPYFYSAGPDGQTVTVFNGLNPTFEFPWSNESLVDPMLNMGTLEYKTAQTVYYRGDAEVGMIITMQALDVVEHVTITKAETRETFKIDTDKLTAMTGHPIIQGDEIVISTIRNDKYVRLLRNGEVINILNAITRDSTWFRLSQGDNAFSYAAEFGLSKLMFRIENQTVYQGV